MKIPGKAFVAPVGLVAATTSVAVCMNQYSTWLDNNPIAQTWLDDNNYTEKSIVKDFESKTHPGTFALGCHRVIFEGRNFRKLYKDDTGSSSVSQTSQGGQKAWSESTSFGSDSEPFVGCSTAFRRTENSKNIYEYEVALKQGERGFVERISVYDDKIYSQLIFFEKNNDGKRILFKQSQKTKTPPYKFVFGLYKYIKQNSNGTGSNKIYQWGNPENNQWSDLDLNSTGSATSPLYYSIWLEGNGDKGIFDNLGIKSKGKLFSSVAKSEEISDSSTNSKFMYFNRSQFTRGAQKARGNQDSSGPTPEQHDLSVLDSLISNLEQRKGSWKSVESFCSEQKPSVGNRAYINEVKKLAQYCYEIKTPPKSPKP